MSIQNTINISIDRRTQGTTQESFALPLLLSENVLLYDLKLLSGANGLRFTSKTNGIVYVNVAYIVAGNSTPLTAVRSGSGTQATPYLITVNVATDSGGLPISTANQIKTACEGVANIDAIVSIALLGTGLGIVSSSPVTSLILSQDFSKAGVYRLFTSLKSVGEIYLTTDLEYIMASKLLSSIRAPKNFAIYSKTSGQTITQAITDLILTKNDWYWLGIWSRAKALVNEAGNVANSLKKIFIGSCDDLTVLDNRNIDREALVLATDLTSYNDLILIGDTCTREAGSYTLFGKPISGLIESNYNTTQLNTIKTKNGIAIEKIAGVIVTNNSRATSGVPIDETVLIDFTVARVKEDLLQLLFSNPKISYDDFGVDQVENTIRARLKNIALSGGIKRVNKSSELDLLKSDDGNYVYQVTSLNVNDIPSNEKSARNLIGVTMAFTVAGAIEMINVNFIIEI